MAHLRGEVRLLDGQHEVRPVLGRGGRAVKKDYPQILKVLVGSHAHGLATPESDYDYRAVFVQPTSEILGIGGKTVSNQWIEGDVDNTAYEVGHFLFLATKSNPTILETFVAPRVSSSDPRSSLFGDALRQLGPYVWDSHAALNAFTGYGYNQRKKFLDNKDQRANKYAVAWLRTLILAHELFTEGTMTLDLTGHPEFERLYEWKMGTWRLGEVMDVTDAWLAKVHEAFDKHEKRTPNLPMVNGFLLDLRREYWS